MDIGTVVALAVLAGLGLYVVVDTILFRQRWRTLQARDAAVRADLDRQLAEIDAETHPDAWNGRGRPRLEDRGRDDG